MLLPDHVGDLDAVQSRGSGFERLKPTHVPNTPLYEPMILFDHVVQKFGPDRLYFGCPIPIEMIRRKYLNNIVEQDHRFIKRRTRPMLGFKAFASAAATLDGIEVTHMIRKGQLTPSLCPFRQFAELAA